jgi:hypothetical protein
LPVAAANDGLQEVAGSMLGTDIKGRLIERCLTEAMVYSRCDYMTHPPH